VETAIAPGKQAAIEQWTADPCGPQVEGRPGSAAFFLELVRARDAYAPWMARELDYAGAAGLDVLDVGCGQGIDLYRYARHGARVTGIDLTPRHVELARSHLAAVELPATVVEGDAERLPFADASFDRVSSNGVLHHTPDLPAALREIRRVLRPRGLATVIVYNRRSLHYWLTQGLYLGLIRGGLRRERSMAGVLSATVERSSIGARPLVRVYSEGELGRLAVQAGLAHVTVRTRHFRLEDTPLTYPLRRWQPAREAVILERIGRAAGWYLVAHGNKPSWPV
jgi:SAM-dependent methyltransferase